MSESFLYRSFYFEPQELINTANMVEKKYKDLDDEVIEQLASRRLPGLLKAIRNLSEDREKVLAFARKLKKMDVRILAYEFPYHKEDKVTQGKVLIILEERYERFIGRRIWSHFQVNPKDSHIHYLLKIAFGREDETFLSLDSVIRKTYNKVFRESNPLLELARQIGKDHKRLVDVFKEWRVYPNEKLERLLWLYILFVHMGRKPFIEKEGEEQIVARLNQLSSNDYNKIIKNYLEAFEFEDFHHEILKQLTDKLSDPRKNLVAWEGFSEEQIEKVKRWLIRNELIKFFAEDTKYQRFKFWGRYVKVMHDVKLIKSPPIAIMDFKQFVVVEFAKTGNAAYFYTKENYEKSIKPKVSSWSLREDDLKNKNIMIHKLPHTVTASNSNYWHRKFENAMTEYINGNFKYRN
ncbi:EH signature domain-containing protein [Alkalihalobacillus deserti]|uniref:EH signature domain-containing protein n=1 Tax=Alkalihalobacillus deserti TaxID=2879466 RepID=UPI001D157575|nr:EH signature domain-containing protein [Alkalihalobacillus deserti]